MVHPLFPIVLAGAVVAPLIQKPQDKNPPPVSPTFEVEKLAALVDDLAKTVVEKEGVPGLTIAVAKGDETLVCKGFGYADAERGVPATEGTSYMIGSLTRQFTAAGILQLADAKKLALDDPLTKYLPEFPAGVHKLEIQHLLANTSGIPGWAKLVAKHPEIATQAVDDAAFFKLFADVPFDFEPGEGFALDSANYALLSLVISKVSGESYADYVRKHVIQPIGLTHTDFCPSEKRPVSFAADCKVISDDTELEIPMPAAPTHATQSLCSTAGDLVSWQHALVERAVFGEHASQLMMAPTKLQSGKSTDYGFAMAITRLGDSPCYVHTGGIGGTRVRVAHYVLPHVTIVVVANCATAPVERIERDLARFVLGLAPATVVDRPLAAEDAARCAGSYQVATTRIQVVLKDGKLSYVAPAAQPVALLHQGDLVFAFQNEADARITFNVVDGKCDGFTLMRGGFQTNGKRMD